MPQWETLRRAVGARFHIASQFVLGGFRSTGRAFAWLPNPFGSPVLAVAFLIVVGGLVGAWINRDTIRILPFEGENGPQLVMQLTLALDRVAQGAETGVDMDMNLRRTANLPDVAIPGTAISLATIVRAFQIGPLAVTEIHGAVQHDGESYRVWLEIDGPNTSQHAVQTEALPSLDDAMTSAAVLLYGVIRPIGAAYYSFSREGSGGHQSANLIERVLRDPSAPGADKGAAHRLWGIVLRDQGAYDDARDQLTKALELTVDRPSKARILVDLGYVDTIEGHWEDAASAFADAANDDPAWSVPVSLHADTLREVGRFAEADRVYADAIERDGSFSDPWLGRGRLRKAEGAYGSALDAYRDAQRLTLAPKMQATIAFERGALLAEIGLRLDAVAEWDRAVALLPSEGADRPDWQSASACLRVPIADFGDSHRLAVTHRASEPTLRGSVRFARTTGNPLACLVARS